MTGIMPVCTVTITRVVDRFRGGVAATGMEGLATKVASLRPPLA